MAKTAEIFPCNQEIFCESYGCRIHRRRAKWSVGSQDGPGQLLMHICDECLKTIIASLGGLTVAPAVKGPGEQEAAPVEKDREPKKAPAAKKKVGEDLFD